MTEVPRIEGSGLQLSVQVRMAAGRASGSIQGLYRAMLLQANTRREPSIIPLRHATPSHQEPFPIPNDASKDYHQIKTGAIRRWQT